MNDTNYTTIKTPDGHYFNVKLGDVEFIKKLMTENKLKLFDSSIFIRKGIAYHYQENIIFEISTNYFWVFEKKSDFDTYQGGVMYFESSLYIDSNTNEIIASFNLYPFKIKILLDDAVKLKQYPAFDSYNAYKLPNGEICFIRHIIGDKYQGYWYISEKVFDHIYKRLAY